tara:strand:- start:338 stop:832 length:495 start_codon:yes stop_codon:yes gene_type:complete
MAVPNTNSFSLQDVVDELNPSSNDLLSCIAIANSLGFDSNYYTAPATSLLEFRNYSAGTFLSLTDGGNHINVTNQSTTSQTISYTWEYVSYTGSKPSVTYFGSNRSAGYTTSTITNTFATDQYHPFTVSGGGFGTTITFELTILSASVDSVTSNNSRTITLNVL